MKFILKKRKQYKFGKCKGCGIQVSVDTAHQWNGRVRRDGSPALALQLCTECNKANMDKYRNVKRNRRDWSKS